MNIQISVFAMVFDNDTFLACVFSLFIRTQSAEKLPFLWRGKARAKAQNKVVEKGGT
jgi:hypothetical protein